MTNVSMTRRSVMPCGPAGLGLRRWLRTIVSGSSTASPEVRSRTRPVWSRRSWRNGKQFWMPSRSFPGRAASSTSTSTGISSSRRRCWGTTRSPTTSCRSSASASPDPGRRLSPGPRRTPSRWRLRPPPPQAFRLASRLPRTTRRRGFNLADLQGEQRDGGDSAEEDDRRSRGDAGCRDLQRPWCE
jgi:hypothetical protein